MYMNVFHSLEDTAEAAMVGGVDRASTIPAYPAKAGSDAEAGLDCHKTGTADQ